jgi:tetratricopeptide (TPR) repeat protein
VLRAEPKHVEALNLLGVVLGRLGRDAAAVASFDRALAAAPGSIDAWYGRGMTLVAMNRPQQAIKSFERVAANPILQVHLLRAKLLMDMGRHDAAPIRPMTTRARIAERLPTRAECGLPEAAFVFCFFNNAFKINPQIFDVWMRLLAADDGRRLGRLYHRGSDHHSAGAFAFLRRARGVGLRGNMAGA